MISKLSIERGTLPCKVAARRVISQDMACSGFSAMKTFSSSPGFFTANFRYLSSTMSIRVSGVIGMVFSTFEVGVDFLTMSSWLTSSQKHACGIPKRNPLRFKGPEKEPCT